MIPGTILERLCVKKRKRVSFFSPALWAGNALLPENPEEAPLEK